MFRNGIGMISFLLQEVLKDETNSNVKSENTISLLNSCSNRRVERWLRLVLSFKDEFETSCLKKDINEELFSLAAKASLIIPTICVCPAAITPILFLYCCDKFVNQAVESICIRVVFTTSFLHPIVQASDRLWLKSISSFCPNRLLPVLVPFLFCSDISFCCTQDCK